MRFIALLKQDSPFYGLFPVGIPVEQGDAIPIDGRLSYLVDWKALTSDQKIDLAHIHTEGRGTAHFLKLMHDGGSFPLLITQVEGILTSETA